MSVTVRFTETPEENEAVYQQRYRIYTEEMNLYQDIADHANHRLFDASDAHSRNLFAVDNGEVVGTLRIHWGSDGPFPDGYSEIYDLPRFLSLLRTNDIATLTRFTVNRESRSSRVPFNLIIAVYEFFLQVGVRAVLLECIPELLNLYLSIGFRPYKSVYNDCYTGILTPMFFSTEDLPYLESIRSPLARTLKKVRGQIAAPSWVKQLPITDHPLGSCEGDGPGGQRLGSLDDLDISALQGVSLFEGLGVEEIQGLFDGGNLLKLPHGSKIISQRTVGRSMYVILAGEVDVLYNGRLINHVGEKELLGEVSFVLEDERSADVFAATPEVLLLRIDDKTVTRVLKHNPGVAARLFMNLSKILAARLVKSTKRV